MVKYDKIDDSGGRSSDFDRKFASKQHLLATHLNTQNKFINKLIN